VLATDQLEALRELLLAELSDLKSADEAADRVHKNLPAKNALTSLDADLVEGSFRERLGAIEGGQLGATAAKAIAVPEDEPKPMQARPLTLSRQPPSLSSVVGLQRKPSACATRSIASSSPRSHASSAVAQQPKRITFDSRSRACLVARSATNTRSQSAASTIASCTSMATKPRGGPVNIDPCPSPSTYGDDRARKQPRDATGNAFRSSLNWLAQGLP
jgi:hypothetical protein